MIYKLILSYDGGRYGGWQVQENATSIQTVVQNALTTVLRKPVKICGSGRTDAGVHALGQVAHFSFPESIDLARVHTSLNAILPHDIRVRAIIEAPEGFHAQYNAEGKIYHYHLHLDPVLDPFKRKYSTHITYPIDLELLKKACAHFVGTHDFTSFAHQANKGSAARNAVRTIQRIDVVEEPGGVRLEFEGKGFLYKMVRNIVGLLLDVGSGKVPLERIPEIFAAKDRRQASKTAPAQGLFLVKVHY